MRITSSCQVRIILSPDPISQKEACSLTLGSWTRLRLTVFSSHHPPGSKELKNEEKLQEEIWHQVFWI